VLRGVAVDEAGKPVAGAEMVVGTAPGSGRYVYTRADGSFEMKGLSAGHVYLSTGGDFSNRDWRLISKASTTQPGPDRGSIKVALPQREPLKIILRRLQYVTASGRVVTTAGNPVAEALVRVKVQARADDKWSSYTVRKVTTDA
jgi:protocatechuate 3,4-dioxygenase beta subunit